MWNNDVEISFVRPSESMDYFFRNGEGDEVYFVHEGSGTLATTFGDVPYKEGDYVIPHGTTYKFEPSGPQRYLLFETPGLIEIPKRYRNEYGQMMEHAPFYHHDIPRPSSARSGSAAISSSRYASATATRTTSSTTTPSTWSAGTATCAVDVLDPRLRADHRADPHAAAVIRRLPGRTS